MSIYKVKFRCTNPECNNLWIEDVPVNTMNQVCLECGGNIYMLSLYNDNIANIDDETLGE